MWSNIIKPLIRLITITPLQSHLINNRKDFLYLGTQYFYTIRKTEKQCEGIRFPQNKMRTRCSTDFRALTVYLDITLVICISSSIQTSFQILFDFLISFSFLYILIISIEYSISNIAIQHKLVC